MILPCISDLILLKDTIFKIPLQSDTMNDLIYFVGHCDPYFMVPHITIYFVTVRGKLPEGELFCLPTILVRVYGHIYLLCLEQYELFYLIKSYGTYFYMQEII